MLTKLAGARAQGLNGIRYEQGDLNALELPAAAFDVAFFHQSLHHAEDLDSCPVRSSGIPAAVSRHFKVLERRDYGGNFLAVIHPHLRLEHLTATERTALLQSIIDAEREHVAAGHGSYYAVFLATL